MEEYIIFCIGVWFVDILRVQGDICPARTAHKRASRRPLMNHPGQRRYPLEFSAFVGLGLRASDIQRFARIQIFKKRRGIVQICPNCSFSSNSGKVILNCQKFADILYRLSPIHNLQDSNTLNLAHRCLSEPEWASYTSGGNPKGLLPFGRGDSQEGDDSPSCALSA